MERRQLIKGSEQAPEAGTTCPLPQGAVPRPSVLALVCALHTEPSLGERRLWVLLPLGWDQHGAGPGFAARMRKGPFWVAGRSL